MKTALPIIALIILLGALVIVTRQKNVPLSPVITPTPLPSITVQPPSIGTRTKTSGCVAQGPLPDNACTPGAADPTLTKEVLCDPSFTTKSIRNVSNKEKDDVYAEYGVTSHASGQYEVDHLISLELGGSNDIANLWPEAADPRPGFHEKDTVENYLHKQMCDGTISLTQAQQQIANNWLQVYKSLPGN
jgi:hypothetical protein